MRVRPGLFGTKGAVSNTVPKTYHPDVPGIRSNADFT
jgi:hypothetical protein